MSTFTPAGAVDAFHLSDAFKRIGPTIPAKTFGKLFGVQVDGSTQRWLHYSLKKKIQVKDFIITCSS